MKMTGRTDKKPAQPSVPKKSRFGLRGKMFILFFLIPICLILAASLLYIWQLNTLSSRLAKGSSDTVSKMTEEVVVERGREIASQCKVFLLTHPEVKKTLFNYDLQFKRIALQKIGVSGYTTLYEVPGSDGVWRTWVHKDPAVVGLDLSTLKKNWGAGFADFWKILTGVKGGKETRGYYDSRDSDGIVRKKYMVSIPVEGTSYVLSAMANPEEFIEPVKLMQESANQFALKTRNIVAGILAGTLILIGFIVALYGYRLTERIKNLTAVADRISIGDLDVEITGARSRDEIGDLANSITRMQESIRLAIKRLREKR